MIVFDLICSQEHVFEAWFGSSQDFEKQKETGLLECPICGVDDVSKAVMAPNLGRKGNQKSEPSAVKIESPANQEQMVTGSAKDMLSIMRKLKQHVEQNFEHVGQDFPEEARKIHFGEAEERGIYGEASAEETEALLDEGIDIFPLPAARKNDA